jgi:hypothetical protein
MTTRETYFKAYTTATKPVGMLYYTFRNQKNGIIQLGKSLWFVFKKEFHEDNIEQMKIFEKQPGFLFWNISDDGEKFIEMHSKEIGQVISNIMMAQK